MNNPDFGPQRKPASLSRVVAQSKQALVNMSEDFRYKIAHTREPWEAYANTVAVGSNINKNEVRSEHYPEGRVCRGASWNDSILIAKTPEMLRLLQELASGVYTTSNIVQRSRDLLAVIESDQHIAIRNSISGSD